jgi:hypothetical protein
MNTSAPKGPTKKAPEVPALDLSNRVALTRLIKRTTMTKPLKIKVKRSR